MAENAPVPNTDVARDLEPRRLAPVIREIELTPAVAGRDLIVDMARAAAQSERIVSRRRSIYRALFLIVTPMFASIVYFFGFAADQYVSETQFMVRSNAATPALMLPTQPLGRVQDDMQVVLAFIHSRDLVAKLEKEVNLRDLYTRPESDFLTRLHAFMSQPTGEDLYEHYKRWTKLSEDEASGVTTMRVFAYLPQDAQMLGSAIMKASEDFINSLNKRAYEDRVAQAKLLVSAAEADVTKVENELREFRNLTSSVDPGREATALGDLIGKMTTELAQVEATIKQQTQMSPNNPGLPSLRRRAESFRNEIEKLRRRTVGDESSIASNLSRYESLTLDRLLAGKKLEAATANLIKAREEAEKQHIYILRIAETSLPDRSDYPRRTLWLLGILALCIGLNAVTATVSKVVREHR